MEKENENGLDENTCIYKKKRPQTFPIKHLLQAQKAVSYHKPVRVVSGIRMFRIDQKFLINFELS